MKFKKLRIAWSVGWGILCVLLVVLWVRSYWRRDTILKLYSSNRLTAIGSDGGTFYVGSNILASPRSLQVHQPYNCWLIDSSGADTIYLKTSFDWNPSEGSLNAMIPSWIVVSICAGCIALSWLRWRFSLRTLLIATTLIALALGTIVWLAHR